jgi:hypothetical protein
MKLAICLVLSLLLASSRLAAAELEINGRTVSIEAPRQSKTPHGKILLIYAYETEFASDPFDKNPAFLSEVDTLFEQVKPEADSLGASHVWLKPKSKGKSGQAYKEYKYSKSDNGTWAPVVDKYNKR